MKLKLLSLLSISAILTTSVALPHQIEASSGTDDLEKKLENYLTERYGDNFLGEKEISLKDFNLEGLTVQSNNGISLQNNVDEEELLKRQKEISETMNFLQNENLSDEEFEIKLIEEEKIISVSKINEEIVTPQSTRQDVNMGVPTAYYDGEVGHYFAQASFSWNNNEWESDLSGPAHPGMSIGGDNSMSISFNNEILRQASSLQLTSSRGNINTLTNPDGVATNNNGVTFTGDDHMLYGQWDGDYNWDSGKISVHFDALSCGTMSVDSMLAHTWDSTDLSSISINSDGVVDVEFTTNENRWTASPNSQGQLNPLICE